MISENGQTCDTGEAVKNYQDQPLGSVVGRTVPDFKYFGIAVSHPMKKLSMH